MNVEKKKNNRISQEANDVSELQRFLAGIAAVLLFIAAIFSVIFWGLSDSTGAWLFGNSVKVGFVFAFVWLAWPQLNWVKDLPGGWMAIVAMLGGVCVFLARPRLLLYVIPYLSAIVGLIVTLAWLQRFTRPRS